MIPEIASPISLSLSLATLPTQVQLLLIFLVFLKLILEGKDPRLLNLPFKDGSLLSEVSMHGIYFTRIMKSGKVTLRWNIAMRNSLSRKNLKLPLG
jgi:hypothetical protein